MEFRLYDRPGTPPPQERSRWPQSLERWLEWASEKLSPRSNNIARLVIYDRPALPAAGRPPWRPRWLEDFERWAAPPADEPEEWDRERAFLAVAALLGLALLVQYAQLWLPGVRAYLLDHNVLERPTWAAFTILKQAALFVLVLIVLAVRDEPLSSIGFPRFNARRLALSLGLLGFFLGAALLRSPGDVLAGTGWHGMVPIWPGERTLFVLLGLTAAVVEETFFRGFAVVWTYRWSGTLVLAVLFPTLVFAAGHALLGVVNIVFAFLVALLFSVLFLWLRDLYWLMVVHFLIDVWFLLA